MKNILQKIMFMPKTIYFNFYYFKFKDALKFPICVSHSIKIKNMWKRNSIYIDIIYKAWGVKNRDG
ncbi:hypothetical protein AXY43_20210 [Clostridium sp. MF28]|nr:hypothetical protein AXY43_20210 [Clostridium sp. MF28]PSM57639.1 hypothetical protein C4L39_11665 [Clostridium diolis]